MALTTIEVMALIILLLATIKILIILINPKSWLAVVKIIYAIPSLTTIIALVLGIITLKYLIVELTIIQIFAVMWFMSLLMIMGFAPYSKEMLLWSSKIFKDKKCLRKAWLSLIIWIILIIWGLYTILI